MRADHPLSPPSHSLRSLRSLPASTAPQRTMRGHEDAPTTPNVHGPLSPDRLDEVADAPPDAGRKVVLAMAGAPLTPSE